MTETLLSPSNVLLFGRVVEDLQIVTPQIRPPSGLKRIDVVAATTAPLAALNGLLNIDTRLLADGERVLVKDQADPNRWQNGIYQARAGAWNRAPQAKNEKQFGRGFFVTVAAAPNTMTNAGTQWVMGPIDGYELDSDDVIFTPFIQGDARHSPFREQRPASNRQIEDMLTQVATRRIARIYGFSYSGGYYELTSPIFFLVHGDGTPASEARVGGLGSARRARALPDPSLSGIAAADFQFADDLRVWSYDKSDYTIRLDVDNGMFEDVLLDPFFGDGGSGGVSGARVSGARVSGARVSGARVSGARVSGARLSGGRGDASD
jgi:hypothetical protein